MNKKTLSDANLFKSLLSLFWFQKSPHSIFLLGSSSSFCELFSPFFTQPTLAACFPSILNTCFYFLIKGDSGACACRLDFPNKHQQRMAKRRNKKRKTLLALKKKNKSNFESVKAVVPNHFVTRKSLNSFSRTWKRGGIISDSDMGSRGQQCSLGDDVLPVKQGRGGRRWGL